MAPKEKVFPEGDFESEKNEDKSDFVVRAAAKIVQKLHIIAKVEEGETVADILPLPDIIAQRISRHGIEKNKVSKKNKVLKKFSTVSKKEVLYALFAHYKKRSPDSLQGIIERADADPPEFIKPLLPKKKV